ncbi:MAG: UvrD-helicase domain-containing protein [Clostridia bacterium]|nr:UvrD-helicase domain-containing protein [Clostridia bacterium]
MEERTWTDSQENAMKRMDCAVLVSAAAGSGKTSVLSERIIRSLTETDPDTPPIDISRILVVTFTRAAAAELKGRISKALGKAMLKHPDDTRLAKQMLLVGSAQISTIDSFFQKSVRDNFEKLGIPSNFRIATEAEALPKAYEVLDALIEEYYQKYNTSSNGNFLSRNRENRFAIALDSLISNRSDGALNQKLLDFYGKFSKYPTGIEVLRISAERLMEDIKKPFFQTTYGVHIRKTQIERVTAALAYLEQVECELASNQKELLACSGILSFDQDLCAALLRALEESDYSACRALAKQSAFPSFPKISGGKSDAASRYHAWRNAFKEENAEQMRLFADFDEADIHRHLQATADLAWMLYSFYSDFRARFLEVKKEHGMLEHNDVRSMLYELLTQDGGAPSEYAKSISSQYDAVYIDEYQDVDSMQDSIFSLIGRDKRFMVGDIKQSIYGFRGSEPRLFSHYRKQMPLYGTKGAGGENGVSVFMSENFRCNKPVIDFANRICSFLFSASEENVGYREEDDLKFAKRCDNPSPAPVQLVVFEPPARKSKHAQVESNAEERSSDTSQKQEILWTAAEISRLLREECLDDGKAIKPSDIAILLRSNTAADDYVEALETLGIPAKAEGATGVLETPFMTDVLNLLRAVDNPYRDIPLSEFLISEFGGFSLEEVRTVRLSADQDRSLFDALTTVSQHEEHPLSQKVRSKLEWLAHLRELAAAEPADRFLHLLYLEELLLPYTQSEELLYLYELARTFQRQSFGGLYGFLNMISKYLENGQAPTSGFAREGGAVRVMTMHKSKGLEFPVVFVGQCGTRMNVDDLKEPLMFHDSVGFASQIFNPLTRNQEETAARYALKSVIEQELKEENIRVLYVALTRARERLYVTGTLQGKMETAEKNARRIHLGDRYSILNASNYLTWLLAAYYNQMPKKDEIPCIFHQIGADESIDAIPLFEESGTKEAQADPQQSSLDKDTLRYLSVLENAKNFEYPLRYLQGLPTKVAASRLSADLLDALTQEDDAQTAVEAQLALMKDTPPLFERLLLQKNTPTSAEIGTATHAFLELCDFERLLKDGVDSECQRLTEQGFLNSQAVEIINRDMIKRFTKSNLFPMIMSAKRVRREQKFGILVPMRELTQNKDLAQHLGEYPLYVQGSIDLLLEDENGKIVLVDYKTDRITKEEAENPDLLAKHFSEKHGMQLSCYARAVKEMLGRAPDQVYIYSLPAAVALPIETDRA